MGKKCRNPHYTSTQLLLILLSTLPIYTFAHNVTAFLSSYPDLSHFTDLLLSSPPSFFDDLTRRSPFTLLAVPNAQLSSTADLTRRLSSAARSDILRYHILLEYISAADLRRFPPSGRLVTTLLQTTGRASGNSGSVNITRDPSSGAVTIHSPSPYSPSNATVLGLVDALPYNISVLAVDSLLVPSGFDLMASETRPPPGLNITKALLDGHNFNVAASMLAASGVVEEFEADEGGAGITLFVPVDKAFGELPSTVKLQSLPADRKAVVLKFHVLHSYYPLGSLESIVNPVQPTLATEDMGAGRFTLNISRVNGSVAIDTGIVQASVTQTVFDQNPVAIFGVSEVLLPKEIFGKNPIVTAKPGGDFTAGEAQPPDVAPSPVTVEGFDGPSASHLSSPPGFRGDASSGAGRSFLWWCIGLLYLVL